MKLVSVALELTKKKEIYFENWEKYSIEIKNFVEDLLRDEVELIVFGSIVRGNYALGISDIDLLIISDRFGDRDVRFNTLVRLLEKYMESPFEFHLVTRNEFENWYKKFILEYRKF